MPFGPYLLKDVLVEGDSLVLELADAAGRVLYRPKRKLRYSHSDDARTHARRLVGSMVTTETYDPSRYSPTEWWLSVTAHHGTGSTSGSSNGNGGQNGSGDVPQQISKIFGPPGTGKTWTLIERVKEHVKQGVATDKIAFLTFTNAAADVARERVLAAFPDKSKMAFANFCTLHSLATRIGGLMGNNIMDIERLRQFDSTIRSETVWMKKGDPTSVEDRPEHPALAIASFARARCTSIEDAVKERGAESLDEREAVRAMQSLLCRLHGRPIDETGLPLLRMYIDAYEHYKRAHRLADYDDVIENAQSDKCAPNVPAFDVLIIDEAQDLSDLQWKFARRLIERAKRVIVAGDDDQAIMVPFGASPSAFLDLPGGREVLEQSRRVPSAVHDYVMTHAMPPLQQAAPKRVPKKWRPTNQPGRVDTTIDKPVRRPAGSGGDTSISIEAQPIRTGDLVKLISHRRSEQWLVMAPTKKTCEQISRGLKALGVPHYERNRPVLDPGESAADIRVMTIHTSKGDEADNAALVVASAGDERLLKDPRLRYVAFTRARRVLYPDVRPAP